MAELKGYQSILNAALDKYAAQGFELKEEDDDFIVLYHEGEEIIRALQSSHKITAAFLQGECEAHLTNCHGI